jgi:hypothetical protein
MHQQIAVLVRSFKRPLSGWNVAIFVSLDFLPLPLPLSIALPIFGITALVIVALRYLDERSEG